MKHAHVRLAFSLTDERAAAFTTPELTRAVQLARRKDRAGAEAALAAGLLLLRGRFDTHRKRLETAAAAEAWREGSYALETVRALLAGREPVGSVALSAYDPRQAIDYWRAPGNGCSQTARKAHR